MPGPGTLGEYPGAATHCITSSRRNHHKDSVTDRNGVRDLELRRSQIEPDEAAARGAVLLSRGQHDDAVRGIEEREREAVARVGEDPRG